MFLRCSNCRCEGSQIPKFPGGHRGRVTPVPIPNTEVKPATADGTACVGVWESRSLPGVLNKKPALVFRAGFFISRAGFLRTLGPPPTPDRGEHGSPAAEQQQRGGLRRVRVVAGRESAVRRAGGAARR